MDKEKYIVEAKMKDAPQKPPFKFKLNEGVIENKHIKDATICARKFAQCVETDWLLPILNAKCKEMMKVVMELRQLVTSYSKSGIALSNEFGSDKNIGMSQWRITQEFKRVWDKLNEITGEPEDGICVKVTPDVFVTEGVGNIQVTVTSNDKIFEKVKIYVNDKLAIEKDYTYGFLENLTVTDTSMIKTVVQIMGVEYTDIKVVTKLFPFFIGSGLVWQDAETVDNAQVYRGHLNGSYDMTVKNDGDKIYVIIPKRLAYQMIRVDMNGFEVPMVTHEDGELLIYESTNTYTAGRYNLDITCNCNCHPNEGTESESTEENNG